MTKTKTPAATLAERRKRSGQPQRGDTFDRRTIRVPVAAAIDTSCAFCQAEPVEPCVSMTTGAAIRFHAGRIHFKTVPMHEKNRRLTPEAMEFDNMGRLGSDYNPLDEWRYNPPGEQVFYLQTRGVPLEDAMLLCLGTIKADVGWFEPTDERGGTWWILQSMGIPPGKVEKLLEDLELGGHDV